MSGATKDILFRSRVSEVMDAKPAKKLLSRLWRELSARETVSKEPIRAGRDAAGVGVMRSIPFPSRFRVFATGPIPASAVQLQAPTLPTKTPAVAK